MIQPQTLAQSLERIIVGQRSCIDAIILAAVAGGHVLVEGPPGVAKTLACKSLASMLRAPFQRIQFTPDILPSDVVGTRVFDQQEHAFKTIPGPIFANIVLADEINRAPAKVQSALLEAMQEEQATIGMESLALPKPFFVLATMNPLENDGTYALAAAQLDRFLLSVFVPLPSVQEEIAIVKRCSAGEPALPPPVATLAHLRLWKSAAERVYVDERIERYIVTLVAATRANGDGMVEHGAGPRASLALARVARARALLDGRAFAIPDDARGAAAMVLRHRVSFTHRMPDREAERKRWLQQLIDSVDGP